MDSPEPFPSGPCISVARYMSFKSIIQRRIWKYFEAEGEERCGEKECKKRFT